MAFEPARRGAYGFDAPYVPLLLGLAALVTLVFGVLASSVFMILGAVFPALSTASFVYTTRRGKFLLWDELLGRLDLGGDETVLDIGCGRGAVLLMAAQLLPQGRAVGIDLWRTADQSGNAEETTRRNARLEGVAERVELHTGDITSLPFDADSFDVVLSSLTIHNIKSAAGRAQAIDEAIRVLRPGGQLVVADIRSAADYADRLRQLGMADVSLRTVGWRGWFGLPWVNTRVVTARKTSVASR